MAEKGDKYIIEIGDVFRNTDGSQLYRIRGFNSLVFDDIGIGKLRPFDMSDTLANVRNAGMSEAWELCRKMECEIPIKDLNTIFGYELPEDVYNNYTPMHAAAIVKKYEQEKAVAKKIKAEETAKGFCVGDVVTHKKTGKKGIVINVREYTEEFGDKERECVFIMTADDTYIISSPKESIYVDVKKDFEKTGERSLDFIDVVKNIMG